MPEATKYCKRCDTTKLVREFYTKRDGTGYTYYCRKCQNEEAVARQQRIKRQCIEYKGKKCAVCGYDRHAGAMDFHHMEAEHKDFNIAEMKQTTFNDTIQKELDKCILLCCRCHREVHGEIIDISAHIVAEKETVREPPNTRKNIEISLPKCMDCGVEVSALSDRCYGCAGKAKIGQRSKISWPPVESLIREIQNSSYSAVARRLGVVDTALRKHLTTRGIDITKVKGTSKAGWYDRTIKPPIALEVDGKTITL